MKTGQSATRALPVSDLIFVYEQLMLLQPNAQQSVTLP